jgi:hypothetical protein
VRRRTPSGCAAPHNALDPAHLRQPA